MRRGEKIADRNVLTEATPRVAEARQQRRPHRGDRRIPAHERIANHVCGQRDQVQTGRKDLHTDNRVGGGGDGGGGSGAQAVTGIGSTGSVPAMVTATPVPGSKAASALPTPVIDLARAA